MMLLQCTMWKFLVPNAAKLRGNFIKYGKENHALFTSFRIKLIILKNDRFWNQKTIKTKSGKIVQKQFFWNKFFLNNFFLIWHERFWTLQKLLWHCLLCNLIWSSVLMLLLCSTLKKATSVWVCSRKFSWT